MRYAVISDIHANVQALRAVLADAADCRVDEVICLGDVLGYGPDPVETLETAYRRFNVCLAGNHDDAICGRIAYDDFTDFAAAAVERQRAQLSDKALAWLRSLPYVWECKHFACTHGEFSDPKNFDYILLPEDALPSWRERREKLLFVGHTHDPCVHVVGPGGTPYRFEADDFQLEAGRRYIVNVGSVGYPRVGNCRSSYCIYDTRMRMVCFRSIPFDLEGYREKMNGRGLEEAPWMTERAKAKERPEVREAESFGREARAGRRRAPRLALGAAALLAAAAVVFALASGSRGGKGAFGGGAAPARADADGQAAEFASMPTIFVNGWRYQLQSPGEQLIEAVPGAGGAFIRMSNAVERVTRLSRRLEFNGKPPERIRFAVKTLPRNRASMKLHWCIQNAIGETLKEEMYDVQRSKKSPAAGVKVPEGADSATLELDVRFVGALELELPKFSVVK